MKYWTRTVIFELHEILQQAAAREFLVSGIPAAKSPIHVKMVIFVYLSLYFQTFRSLRPRKQSLKAGIIWPYDTEHLVEGYWFCVRFLPLAPTPPCLLSSRCVSPSRRSSATNAVLKGQSARSSHMTLRWCLIRVIINRGMDYPAPHAWYWLFLSHLVSSVWLVPEPFYLLLFICLFRDIYLL